jgi:hypothetical protein
VGGNAPKCLWSIPTNGNICSKIKAYDYCFLSFLSQFTHKQGKYDLKMAFKKQLVTSCKQAIWGEILGGNAPNYAVKNPQRVGTYSYTTNGGMPKTVPVIDGQIE